VAKEPDQRASRQKEPGRKAPSQKELGRKEPGRKEASQKELGQKELGQKELGQKELGQKELDQKELGQKEPSRKEPGRKEAGQKELGSTLARLWRVIESRRGADPQASYTARLFVRGRTKIAQKLGEEAVEAVIEGIRGDPEKLVGESADLLYHLLVLWADVGVAPKDVAAELTRRERKSGIEEKRGRAKL
jgi:phosphoribosyl-ATP pyrophosphohydrolase